MAFVPLPVFGNLPQTTVVSGGTTAPTAGTVETWTVNSSASFPGVKYGAQSIHVSDPAANSELITVQGISGSTWTVARGAEGTVPVSHAGNFTVIQVVSAGDLQGLQYPAWQFPVQAYGAEGDGKIGTGGTGTSGTSTFTDAGANFVNAAAPAGDVGKYIVINQGTGSGTVPTNPFVGTITAVNSSTSVTLSGNLGANASSAPYVYGTDDASAINSAVLAAAQWAVSTGNYKAQVMFQPGLYMLGGLTQSTTYQWSPFNTGLNYTYNTHIPIPFTTATARKLVLDFIGVGDASEPDYWGSSVPSVQGTCLVSAVFAASQPDATFGQMSVLGGPSAETNIGGGGLSAGFANVLVNINGISVVTPYNAQQYSFDLRWCAQANIPNAAALAFAPVNLSGATVGGTWLRSTTNPANGVAVGLAMPTNGNNDNDNIGLFSAEGIYTGLLVAEHFTAQRIATIFCNTGIAVNCSQPAGAAHGGSILYWSCEGGVTCLSTLNVGATNQYPLFIGSADFETINTYYVDDQGANLTGTMYWYDFSQYTPYSAGPSIRGGTHYQVINTRMYPGIWAANAGLGISGPPAAPATGTAQQNIARPATVYCSATTSITSVAVGPTSGSLTSITVTAGANVAVPVRVPMGYWYSVTYSGTLTTTWDLD